MNKVLWGVINRQWWVERQWVNRDRGEKGQISHWVLLTQYKKLRVIVGSVMMAGFRKDASNGDSLMMFHKYTSVQLLHYNFVTGMRERNTALRAKQWSTGAVGNTHHSEFNHTPIWVNLWVTCCPALSTLCQLIGAWGKASHPTGRLLVQQVLQQIYL